MKLLAAALLPLACLASAQAQDNPHAQEIQRALIERDRQAAEFARGTAPQPLPPETGRPLHPDPAIARELRPYERIKAQERMRDEEAREIRFSPPVVLKPSPLPGGPRHGVDPVPSTGVGG